MPNIYCTDCIDKAIKIGATTPCVRYQYEPNHQPRMVTECAWMASILQDIFVLHLSLVKAELTKRKVPITEK